MSEQNPIRCEFPTKSWDKYNPTELKRYFVRNMKKCDCSFVLIYPKNDSSERVLESFKWILREMSTTLEKILNSESSKAKNWKLIPISDPNFETILTFGHTKTLDVESFDNLVRLYESAYNFNIPALRDAILTKLKVNDEVYIDWINFFRVAYMTKYNSFYSELYEIFNEKVPKMNVEHMERTLENKTHLILNFDEGKFYELFDAIKTRPLKPLICFKIVEAYVLKNIFNEGDPLPSDLQGNTTRDVVNLFLETIAFDKMSHNDFQNGPGKSVWIDEAVKERILKKIS